MWHAFCRKTSAKEHSTHSTLTCVHVLRVTHTVACMGEVTSLRRCQQPARLSARHWIRGADWSGATPRWQTPALSVRCVAGGAAVPQRQTGHGRGAHSTRSHGQPPDQPPISQVSFQFSPPTSRITSINYFLAYAPSTQSITDTYTYTSSSRITASLVSLSACRSVFLTFLSLTLKPDFTRSSGVYVPSNQEITPPGRQTRLWLTFGFLCHSHR